MYRSWSTCAYSLVVQNGWQTAQLHQYCNHKAWKPANYL
jgi:hypothetical protein